MQAGLAAGEAVPSALADLVRPHIDSYDWFVTDGIRAVVDFLEPVEVSQAHFPPSLMACSQHASRYTQWSAVEWHFQGWKGASAIARRIAEISASLTTFSKPNVCFT
jgi:hypothetical protein